MKKIIKKIYEKCLACNRDKIITKKYGHTYPNSSAKKIGEAIDIDLKSPINSKHFKTSRKSEFYICTFIDLFSQYTYIAILWDISTITICNALDKVLIKMIKPEKILTDPGKQFISSKFKEYLKNLNIKHIMSSTYNPTGNSIVERINLEIGLCLKLSRGKGIEKIKEYIWKRLNLLQNRNLGYSPYEIYYVKSIFMNYKKEIKVDNEIIINKQMKTQRNNNKKDNEKRIKVKYNPGDYVFTKNFSHEKVNKRWNGPYKVIKVNEGGNTLVLDKGNKRFTASIKNTKPLEGGEDVETQEVFTIKSNEVSSNDGQSMKI
ncbi:Pro-Pol polyprotein [Dictyocoela muelleri]|nr:Pro-Pol polyprotein [Dictyocoela muelleri]